MSDLTKRLIVAAFGIPPLMFAAIRGGWPLYVLVGAIQAVSLWEWRALSAASGARLNVVGAILLIGACDFLVLTHGNRFAVSVFVTVVCVVLLSEVFRTDRQPSKNLGALALYAGYVVLPLAIWCILADTPGVTHWKPIGPLAALFITTWGCDTAAYFGGKRFGRHKLHVVASPNKTVEGFIAGVAFSFVVLPILSALNLATPTLTDYIALPLIVGIAGQIGDLLESLMKREVQVKDTSAVLPGHGGFLDRFDSLLISSPLLFAYLNLSPV